MQRVVAGGQESGEHLGPEISVVGLSVPPSKGIPGAPVHILVIDKKSCSRQSGSSVSESAMFRHIIGAALPFGEWAVFFSAEPRFSLGCWPDTRTYVRPVVDITGFLRGWQSRLRLSRSHLHWTGPDSCRGRVRRRSPSGLTDASRYRGLEQGSHGGSLTSVRGRFLK